MIELQECIEKLSSEDEADRIYAAEDIGYANLPEGVPPLLARLPDEPSRAAREAIFGALLQIEDDSVVAGAIALLDSDDPFLRNQSVVILRARGPAAIPFLDRAFEEGDQDRRKFVLDVLGKMSEPSTATIYAKALEDNDINVVITAVENLGLMGMHEFREAIKNKVRADAHPMLLGACLEALAQIGTADSIALVRQRLIGADALPGYLAPPYLKLLGAQGQPSDVAEIAAFIGNNGLQSHVLNALTTLHQRFGDLQLPANLVVPLESIAGAGSSPLVAYQAVRLLGVLQQRPDVFEFLGECLGHPEKAIRIAAVQALRDPPSARSETLLKQKLSQEKDEEVLQALKWQS